MSLENYQQEIAKLEQDGNMEALKKMESESKDPVAECAQQAIDRLLEKQEQGKVSQHYAEEKIGTEKAASLTREIDDEIDQLNMETQKEIENVMSEEENSEDVIDLTENSKELSLDEIRVHIAESEKAFAKQANEVKSVRFQTKEEIMKNLENKQGVSDNFFDSILNEVNDLEKIKTKELIKIKNEYLSSEEAKQIQEEKSDEIAQLENSINDKASVVHIFHKKLLNNPEDKALRFYMWKYFHGTSLDFNNYEVKNEIIDIIVHSKLRTKLMEAEKNFEDQQNQLMDQMVGKYSKRVVENYLG